MDGGPLPEKRFDKEPDSDSTQSLPEIRLPWVNHAHKQRICAIAATPTLELLKSIVGEMTPSLQMIDVTTECTGTFAEALKWSTAIIILNDAAFRSVKYHSRNYLLDIRNLKPKPDPIVIGIGPHTFWSFSHYLEKLPTIEVAKNNDWLKVPAFLFEKLYIATEHDA